MKFNSLNKSEQLKKAFLGLECRFDDIAKCSNKVSFNSENESFEKTCNPIDSANEECVQQMEVVEEVLNKLGASEIPTIYVFNKIDLVKFFFCSTPFT